jgi:Ser/Thr protein kinase RdoA (MazF antagonist)
VPLPGFHDTPARLAALAAALEAAPPTRARAAQPEARALLQRRELAAAITTPLGAGQLPLRVVHNDTKLANVLFAAGAARALRVLDLDTVMPGTPLHDFGDLVRSAVSAHPSEAAPPGVVGFDAARFAALARGFLRGCGDLLTPPERALLPLAPAVLALELAARFLADHLQGDRYFRVARPGDNLARARRQLRLLEALEAHQHPMEAILAAES